MLAKGRSGEPERILVCHQSCFRNKCQQLANSSVLAIVMVLSSTTIKAMLYYNIHKYVQEIQIQKIKLHK